MLCSRRMPKLQTHLTYLAITALFVPTALAEDFADDAERVVIHPTGHYPTDVQTVQAVVDTLAGRDAVIVLKARNQAGRPTAFDFGTDADPTQRGSILVTNDKFGSLTFAGEARRGAHTTIIGGNIAINFQRRDRLIVRDIEFRRPYLHAVLVQRSSDVTVKNNTILDLEGVVDRTNEFPLARAVSFRAISAGAERDITGRILIRGNTVERTNAAFADAFHFINVDAEVRVVDNLMNGLNVGVRSNIQSQSFVVARNHFTTRRDDFFGTSGAIFGCNVGPKAQVKISNNYFDADTTAISLQAFDGVFFAISCPMYSVSIVGNDLSARIVAPIELVTLTNDTTQLFDTRITRNTFRGTAPFGITFVDFSALLGLPGQGETFDVLVARNSFDLFEGATDISLGPTTRDNLIKVGPNETVVDEGTNNRIVRRR